MPTSVTETLLLTDGMVNVNHRWTDTEASLKIAGFGDTLKILHLSDNHITVSNESDIPFQQYAERVDRAFSNTTHFRTGEPTTPLECFRAALQVAQSENVDMIVLTGDVVNNPSKTSVATVYDELEKVGIPYIYTAGNHDWHYEGLEGSSNELRETWRKKGLRPLYGTDSPPYSAVVKNGINVIAIDNSTYQVDDQQLAFFEQQMALGLPSVLLIHIPLCLTSFPCEIACGHPDWGSKTDKVYTIERRPRWPEEGNLKSTMDFVKAVSSSGNLVAVLCGHTHNARTDRITPLAFPEITSPSAVQYIAGAGAAGGYRLVSFEGLEVRS